MTKTAWEAIEEVLEEAAPYPMHYIDITAKILDEGLWEARGGKTPERSISERLTRRMRKEGENCPWKRVGPGQYVWRDKIR